MIDPDMHCIPDPNPPRMSTSVLKMAIDKGYGTNDPDEAINILYGGEHHAVIIYARSEELLEEMSEKIYAEIKDRNAKIPEIDDQMLPTRPHRFNAVHQCLPAFCAEISMNTFKVGAGLLYVHMEPNYDVLTDPSARRSLSLKALASLNYIWLTIAEKLKERPSSPQ